MPNLTNYGQQYAAEQIVALAVGLALFQGSTAPNRVKGPAPPYWGVVEVVGGAGTAGGVNGYQSGTYTTGGAGPYVWGGVAISPWVATIPFVADTVTPVVSGDWSALIDSDGHMIFTLASQTWTSAAGMSISNIGGAFLYDAAGNVITWWAYGSITVTLSNGDDISTGGLFLKYI